MANPNNQLEPFPEVIELDEIDKKVLRILQVNGKTSLRTIAERIGNSVSTIKSHVDRLMADGVIENFIAVVNCDKIGFREMLHFYIQVTHAVKLKNVVDELLVIPEINVICHVSGDFPLFCIAKCVKRRDQVDLLESIKAIHGIEKIRTQVVLQRFKEDMRVRIPDSP
ncbi:MAG: Lrp/AsnC family transcriptional regulator [Promethearchaeota archaeon]